MRIKSKIWQWLAMASFGVGMVFACGVEGASSDAAMVNNFVTSMSLLAAAIVFMRLGFAAEDRERAAKQIKRNHARNPEYPGDQERGA